MTEPAEPAIDDGYAQAAAEDRAEALAGRYDEAQAEADQQARYLPALAEPHPEQYSYEAAVNGKYPALCDDPDCQPCQASEATWRQEEAALDAAWRREELERAAAVEAEVDEEARALAAQADRDAELDARQMDAPAENAAREAQAREPEAGV